MRSSRRESCCSLRPPFNLAALAGACVINPSGRRRGAAPGAESRSEALRRSRWIPGRGPPVSPGPAHVRGPLPGAAEAGPGPDRAHIRVGLPGPAHGYPAHAPHRGGRKGWRCAGRYENIRPVGPDPGRISSGSHGLRVLDVVASESVRVSPSRGGGGAERAGSAESRLSRCDPKHAVSRRAAPQAVQATRPAAAPS